jgi:hypothetical protein
MEQRDGEVVHHSEEFTGANAEVTIQVGRKVPLERKFAMLEVVVSTTIPCRVEDMVKGTVYRQAGQLTERELDFQIKHWEDKLNKQGG